MNNMNNNNNNNSSNDFGGLDVVTEDEVVDEYNDIRNKQRWRQNDRRCVNLAHQKRGPNWAEIEKKEKILDINLGNADIENGKYYYVIKARDPENIYLFHSKYENADAKNKSEVIGHSSFLTKEEYDLDIGQQFVDNSRCIVYYAGELIYHKNGKLPAVKAWNPGSGHFLPEESQHKKVGLPMDNFKKKLGFTKEDVDVYMGKGGKRGKKKSRKLRKVRKHQGIIQSGGNKGRLNKGYRYSGKKLKSGLSQIIKCKKKL